MPATVVIKKYENRRLYDTAQSRYVNLDEIARMIRDGAEILVQDARSGEDLTRVVLTQIILEDARQRKGELPVDFLRQMVVASGRALEDALRWYEGTLAASTRPFASPFGGAPGEVDELRRKIAELGARLAAIEETGPALAKTTRRRRKKSRAVSSRRAR